MQRGEKTQTIRCHAVKNDFELPAKKSLNSTKETFELCVIFFVFVLFVIVHFYYVSMCDCHVCVCV